MQYVPHDYQAYATEFILSHPEAAILLDMMFGYATDETAQMLPIPYVLACDALERLAGLKSPMLLPDAKCQVTHRRSGWSHRCLRETTGRHSSSRR